MSSSEESQDIDPEGYHTIMEYIKKVNERIDTLSTKIEQVEESFKKSAQESPKAEIVGYCEECRHPLTSKECEGSVCPYCRKSTKYKQAKPSEGLGLLGLF